MDRKRQEERERERERKRENVPVPSISLTTRERIFFFFSFYLKKRNIDKVKTTFLNKLLRSDLCEVFSITIGKLKVLKVKDLDFWTFGKSSTQKFEKQKVEDFRKYWKFRDWEIKNMRNGDSKIWRFFKIRKLKTLNVWKSKDLKNFKEVWKSRGLQN